MVYCSFTLPTLNEAANIEKTLRSILDQTVVKANRGDFEIVVIDSDSTDRTVEIADRYADLIVLAPKGLLTARTLGTQYASGAIIMNVNADAYYPPEYAGIMLSHFDDPNVVAVGGSYTYPGPVALVTKMFNDSHPKPWMPGLSNAYRKSAFEAIGGFDMSIDQTKYMRMVWAEENDFAQRLARVGKVDWEPRAVAVASPRRFEFGKMLKKREGSF